MASSGSRRPSVGAASPMGRRAEDGGSSRYGRNDPGSSRSSRPQSPGRPGFVPPSRSPHSPTPGGSRPPAPGSPSGGREGGLAARRNFSPQMRLQTDQATVSTKKTMGQSRGGRRIRRCGNALEYYDMGKQVMESCHPGMEVIFAKHRATGNEVVIKFRHKEKSFGDKAAEREWRESTEFMLNLPSSTEIAQIYEVLEDPRGYYIVMEKVDGADLFETVSGKGLIPVEEVKEVLRQLLAALRQLHDRGCVHRDLKLENVMFTRVGVESPKYKCDPTRPESPSSPVAVKLIDFDTVEAFEPASPKKTKDVLGTDQYIAQEAYDGIYSPASDIFATGVIAFKLLTGKFPFDKSMFNDGPGENWVGSPKMKEIREKLCNFRINWNYQIFNEDPQALQLVRWMLAVNENQRPSADAAMTHPWLYNMCAAPAPDVGLSGARRASEAAKSNPSSSSSSRPLVGIARLIALDISTTGASPSSASLDRLGRDGASSRGDPSSARAASPSSPGRPPVQKQGARRKPFSGDPFNDSTSTTVPASPSPSPSPSRSRFSFFRRRPMQGLPESQKGLPPRSGSRHGSATGGRGVAL